MKRKILLTALFFVFLIGGVIDVNAKSIESSEDYEVVESFDVRTTRVNKVVNNAAKPNVPLRGRIKYKVTLIGTTSVVGDYTGQSVSGDPGMTISLSNLKGESFAIVTNVASGVKDVAEAALGFSFSKDVKVTHSGTRKVPKTYNGRKVKRAEIKAYLLYDKYDYKVTWTSNNVKTPMLYGTYWTKRPCGYHYETTYYYK